MRAASAASAAMALAVLWWSGVAGATAQRTFVASYGLPGNTASNCSIIKPCRAFAEAISVTTAGGEVIVLDSAGYGPVTITQSVSITAPPGVYAGISVFSGTGIIVFGAGIDVALRGLSVNGLGGATGIANVVSATLVIERCSVTGMTAEGIFVAAPGGLLTITDTIVTNNNQKGINFSDLANPNTVSASLARVRSEYNLGSGLYVGAGARVRVQDSAFNRNFIGVEVDSTISNTRGIQLELVRSTASENEADNISIIAQGAKTTHVEALLVDNVITSSQTTNGVQVWGFGAGSIARVTLTRNHILNNPGVGIAVSLFVGTGAANVRLSGNVIMSNANYGVIVDPGAGAIVRSLGENFVDQNTPSDVLGTITKVPGI